MNAALLFTYDDTAHENCFSPNNYLLRALLSSSLHALQAYGEGAS